MKNTAKKVILQYDITNRYFLYLNHSHDTRIKIRQMKCQYRTAMNVGVSTLVGDYLQSW